MKSKVVQTILCFGMVVSGMSSTRAVHSQETPRHIEITAKRFAYAPNVITLKKGQPVVLVIRSMDVAHGLRFRDLNLNTKINKGRTAELKFTPEKTGDFIGHCSVFCGSGHGGMILTLHVVD